MPVPHQGCLRASHTGAHFSSLEGGKRENVAVSSSCLLPFIGQHLPPALGGSAPQPLKLSRRRASLGAEGGAGPPGVQAEQVWCQAAALAGQPQEPRPRQVSWGSRHC